MAAQSPSIIEQTVDNHAFNFRCVSFDGRYGLTYKRKVENPFSIRTAFSRGTESLKYGQRLESTSWSYDPSPGANVATSAISICPQISEGHYASGISELSGVVDSLLNKKACKFDFGSASSGQNLVNTRSRGLEMPDDLVIAIREKKQLVTIPATPKLELVESRDSHNTVDSVIPDSASGWSAKAPSSQSSAASGTSKSITTLVVRGFSPGNTIQQQPKKQSLFKEEAATRTVRRVIQENQPFDDDVFETDEEDIDESAIDDDDDSSDWEDSNEDSDNVGIDEKTFFQRVDSRPRLASCRSLLTVALHQNDRTNGLTNQAVRASRSTPAQQRSRASSPNGPSLAPFPDSGEAPLTMKKSPLKAIAEVPRTSPHLIPHSPTTTRRNMLATELTVSLRQHLLWEQQQKFQTVNAVLKRRRIARDVTSLKQYPEMSYMRKDANEIKTSYWNQYFSQRIGDYNSEGW